MAAKKDHKDENAAKLDKALERVAEIVTDSVKEGPVAVTVEAEVDDKGVLGIRVITTFTDEEEID